MTTGTNELIMLYLPSTHRIIVLLNYRRLSSFMSDFLPCRLRLSSLGLLRCLKPMKISERELSDYDGRRVEGSYSTS